MSYLRDYETQGQTLIRLKGSLGVVNATTENFNMSTEEIINDEGFIKRHEAESGVFCLIPDELDIPF